MAGRLPEQPPRTNFALPGTDLGPFFDGLARGVENALVLGAPRIVLGSGVGFPGAKRAQNLERLIDVFSQAVERTAGYAGPIGLEYFPTVESGESLNLIRSLAATAWGRPDFAGRRPGGGIGGQLPAVTAVRTGGA
jgi:hypothetical protein